MTETQDPSAPARPCGSARDERTPGRARHRDKGILRGGYGDPPRRRRVRAALLAGLAVLLVGAAARAGETPPPSAPPAEAAGPESAPDVAPPAAPEAEAPEGGEREAPPAEESPPEGEAPEPPAEGEAEVPPPPEPGGPIRLNFRDASVHAVLTYLSEATGLVIVQDEPIDGRVTVISRQPVNTEEAVALLEAVLKGKGYAAVRTGRTLKIVPLEQAAKENLPVLFGNDPSQIPATDRLVTQVIPVRYADATRLRTDLAPLIPETATVSSNAASNTLVLVDSQANIRRVAEIIRAVDEHMAGVADVKVFQLEYADATNVARLISELFEQEGQQGGESGRQFIPEPLRRMMGRGRRGGEDRGGDGGEAGRQQRVIATADDATNTLVVSAPPDLMPLIESVVKELDSNPNEEESFFIYPLKNADAKNLEEVLNAIFSETTATAGTTRGGTAREGQTSRFGRSTGLQRTGSRVGDMVGEVYCIADEDTNSLIVRTLRKHFDRIKEMLAELDRAIPQVLIKVLIAEVTHDEELDLGTEFSILNLQFAATVEGTGDLGTEDQSGGGLVTATLNSNLAATFNALQRDGRMDVLSRPYILASDNQEATITVGQEVPFIRNSRTTETGQTINTIEYEDVGIILTVTPKVNPEGLVLLEVAPEISTVTDTTVPISETVNATIYAKRSAQTQVAIHNGQTIVIGGLMEDRITDAVRKVPFLGDIPLLGELFKHTTKDTTKTELLIFLTPHVAEQPDHLAAMSADETADLKAVREAGGSGAFEEHLDSMKRGATPKPDGGDDAPQP